MDIVCLDRTLVLAIHERQLAEHGGGSGIRDESLLESALARPHQLLAYGEPPPDLAALAACLAHGIARTHPFVDGNKRTAHVCYRAFLLLNGSELYAPDEAKYTAVMGLADGTLDEAGFADWLRRHIAPGRASTRLNEPQAGYGR